MLASGIVFVFLGKESSKGGVAPEPIRGLLEELVSVFPKDLPEGLPPLRDIRLQIDLVLGSNLPISPITTQVLRSMSCGIRWRPFCLRAMSNKALAHVQFQLYSHPKRMGHGGFV
jgi:hypothetical protein